MASVPDEARAQPRGRHGRPWGRRDEGGCYTGLPGSVPAAERATAPVKSSPMHWLARICNDHPRASRPFLRLAVPPLIVASEWLAGDVPSVLLELASVAGRRVYRRRRLGNGMDMMVPLNDLPGAAIARDGYYEPDTVRVFERILKPGMVFFDVGAHCGQYTLLGSPLVGERGQVHSFEPDPRTNAQLRGNVARNGLANVTVNQAAVGAADDVVTFFESSAQYAGTSGLRPSPYFSGRSYPVACTTLGSYLTKRGLTRIDVMKIDIEGAELDLLMSTRALLTSDTRPVIVMEFNNAGQQRFGHLLNESEQVLRQYGYDIFRISDLSVFEARPDDPSYFNVLAWPTNQPQSFLAD
jgi:FkbM family methyltransferase